MAAGARAAKNLGMSSFIVVAALRATTGAADRTAASLAEGTKAAA